MGPSPSRKFGMGARALSRLPASPATPERRERANSTGDGTTWTIAQVRYSGHQVSACFRKQPSRAVGGSNLRSRRACSRRFGGTQVRYIASATVRTRSSSGHLLGQPSPKLCSRPRPSRLFMAGPPIQKPQQKRNCAQTVVFHIERNRIEGKGLRRNAANKNATN